MGDIQSAFHKSHRQSHLKVHKARWKHQASLFELLSLQMPEQWSFLCLEDPATLEAADVCPTALPLTSMQLVALDLEGSVQSGLLLVADSLQGESNSI